MKTELTATHNIRIVGGALKDETIFYYRITCTCGYSCSAYSFEWISSKRLVEEDGKQSYRPGFKCPGMGKKCDKWITPDTAQMKC